MQLPMWLAKFGLRAALWQNPLLIERKIMQAYLEQMFGAKEAARWLGRIEKKKREAYARSKV